jgi:outer membrane protein OmpA-like peptidoglycan-associated protein
MTQKELDEKNMEIKSKAYELYEKHGFKDGNDFVDWLEAERQAGTQSNLKPRPRSRKRNVLLAAVGILCVVVAVLSFLLLRPSPKMELSQKSLTDLKVMMLVLDQKPDEDVIAFGDTHFDFDQSTLSGEAKTLLEKDVLVLKENPKTTVRMAGYTSAQGTEAVNQKISEKRANAVRDFLIEKGIAPERITTIGYGRTKPAVFEAVPGDTRSKEAMANMRVLFEIVVK